jgi:DNA-binding GntR family transcriptional regulator
MLMTTISKTMRDDLVGVLQQLILSGEYVPGQRIREEEIVEKYGVSRTPIREAIVSLEQEGLVEIRPHRGVFVASFSPEEIVEILRIEGVMEGLAASLAAQNLSDEEIEKTEAGILKTERKLAKQFKPEDFYRYDQQFHHWLVRGSGSPVLIRILEKQLALIYLCRFYTITAPERFPHSIREHAEVVKYLKQRDSRQAEKAARNHLESVIEDYKKMEEAASNS